MSDLLKNLNPQQLQATTHLEGAAVVLAGAGSGKTRVLTTRVAWLIKEHGVHPSEILLVTFTNKAAQEMNHRVSALTGSKLPFSGTFHRICAQILRKDGYLIGLKPGFVIFDSDDQLSLIKQVYKTENLSVKDFNPQAVKGVISKAKNDMIGVSEYEKLATGEFQEVVARVYRRYQNELKEQQAVDFDDLMLMVVKLFQSYKEVLAKYQDQFKFVLVDEYQDTNKVQYQLTKLFSRPQNNLYVVGDFAQSIYAWRGADYRNLMNLKHDFPDVVEYKLEQNYRSTQTILTAATGIISQTTEYPVLSLWTENTESDQLLCLETETGEDEAAHVISQIQLLRDAYALSDMAILYRTNAQSRPFEEALVRSGLPYRLVGGFKFYERKEIKDALAYLRLVANPVDKVSRERALKLGKRRFADFEAWLLPHLAALPPETERQPQPPLELIQQILEVTKYLEMFDKNDPDDVSRIENVQELLNVAAQFQDTNNFLENIALIQDDYLADVDKDGNREQVVLMSLHSAKGLEFPVVFMVGMEEGLLPHSRSLFDKAQMEEERRLCYVGITRAKEKLFFTHARKRWIYGTPTYALRSRFLQDIPEGILLEKSMAYTNEYQTNQYNQVGRYNWQNNRFAPKPTPKQGRHLVIDDEVLDGVLSGEMDIKSFLDS